MSNLPIILLEDIKSCCSIASAKKGPHLVIEPVPLAPERAMSNLCLGKWMGELDTEKPAVNLELECPPIREFLLTFILNLQ